MRAEILKNAREDTSMKKKIAAALAAAAAMLCAFSGTTYAENNQDTSRIESVQPRYSYTVAIYSNITIDGTTATCKSSATGMTGVTQIEATQYLERKISDDEWESVDHWYSSVSGNILEGMTNKKENLSSGTYRVRSVYVVHKGSASETLEKISFEKTI